ncbi:cell cycle control protein 50C-like isoform X2 [Castor canadensis]|uniref:Cell cycle control protein 50C-like isoform X2 n=1 Tax=Castor canadensis TaxID=51338 RepID=A0AC58MI26_CASCN
MSQKYISVTYRTKMERRPERDLSRQPDNTAMKQQQLPGHQLHFSAPVVLSIFFATAAFCLCMGIILILSAKSTKEIEINYTKTCANCSEMREDASNFNEECTCSIPFYLQEKMEGNVYMYYKLYGFYQNLYRYILSRSNSQLMDTIILSYNLHTSIYIKVPMLKTELTWWTDKYVKFQNPSSSNLATKFAGTTKPPNWHKPIYELDMDDPGNNGFINDDFIVWMRTAAFPTFKKLYRRLYRIHYFVEGLPAGNYSFNILYNFPVTKFQGEKSVVLSTMTWSGGSGLFLGLAYTVTGALTWLASFAMMAIHLMLKNKKSSFSQ